MDQLITDNTIYSLQSELIYKLQLLQYNTLFIQKYNQFTLLNRASFIIQNNINFTYFISLIQWLLSLQSDIQYIQLVQYNTYDDPNTIIDQIIKLMKLMGYTGLLEHTKLRTATGSHCIELLEYLCNYIMSYNSIHIDTIQYMSGNDELNQLINNNEHDDSIDDDIIVSNNNTSHHQSHTSSKPITDSAAAQSDRIQLQQLNIQLDNELEQYNKKLLFKPNSITGNKHIMATSLNTAASLQSTVHTYITTVHSDQLDKLLYNVYHELQSMESNIQQTEKQWSRTYSDIAPQYNSIHTDYIDSQNEYNELQQKLNESHSNMQQLVQQCELIKSQISERDTINKDNQPLKKIQLAYTQLKSEYNKLDTTLKLHCSQSMSNQIKIRSIHKKHAQQQLVA